MRRQEEERRRSDGQSQKKQFKNPTDISLPNWRNLSQGWQKVSRRGHRGDQNLRFVGDHHFLASKQKNSLSKLN